MTSDAPTASSIGSFGETFYVEPKHRHTHTAIMLHGRGSYGEEFADEFFETRMSDGSTFVEKLPSWKWVFPSSQTLWSTAFEEEMPAWFEVPSLTDPTARQDLQISGIRDSVKFLSNLVDQEAAKLEGRTERVIIIGISQGSAIGLWTLLSLNGTCTKVGAFIGASTWLPFADDLKYHFSQKLQAQNNDSSTRIKSDAYYFIESTITTPTQSLSSGRVSSLLKNTPVFLGHGVDDAYVDIELGRQARDVLISIGLNVEWKEYEGAEQEGHWFQEPAETDDILQFLQKLTGECEVS